MDPSCNSIFKDSILDHYLNRSVDVVFDNVTLFKYVENFEIFTDAQRSVPVKREKGVYYDKQNYRIVQRAKSIITRCVVTYKLDGEKHYDQKLVLNVSFRSIEELISDSNHTKTYREECTVRGLLYEQEDSDNIAVYQATSNQISKREILNLKAGAT